MNNLVTVIIPSYNHSKYITQTIQSVISQSYQHIELIIIDDGSKDNSIELINSLESECIKRFDKYIFIHRENKGLCQTLNEAINISSGEYISIIASDDVMKKDKTLRQVDYLKKHPDCVGVFSGADIVKENGELLVSRKGSFKKYNFKDIILNEYLLFSPSATYKSCKLKKFTPYPNDILLEDWYMNLKITENGGYLIALTETLILYRRHSNNTSLQSSRLHDDRRKILSLFKNSPYYNMAKTALIYTIACESVSFNKKNTLLFLLKSTLMNPRLIFRKNTLVTIVKFILPKKYLKKKLEGQ